MQNNTLKCLILGANGLIGQHTARICKEKNILFTGTCFSRQNNDYISFNQLDFEQIPRLFDEVSPTLVINTIGLAGGVNFCEENPETGRKYHVEATEIMTNWCKKNNAGFVYISSDYVFDGENPPYSETDETNPLNLYGKLKLEGENYIKQNLEKYIIARTTNVFGWDPFTKTPNFLMNVIQTLEKEDKISVPAFLYGNPTYAGDLAAGIMDLALNNKWGLFHIVGPGYINRYDWTVKLLEMGGIKNKRVLKIDSPPQNIVPRPLKSNLDTTKFRTFSSIKMHDVDEGLQIFINQMKA